MDDQHKKNSKKEEKEKNAEHEKCENRIKELEMQSEDYKNKYLRALADYQNQEKRSRSEKWEAGNEATAQLLLELLPFLDNLNKAEIFIKDTGLKMIKEQFEKTLEDLGLIEIDIIGKQFDPQYAEAVETVEGEKDNIVVEVIRKGYMLGERILRVALVKVSKIKNLEN